MNCNNCLKKENCKSIKVEGVSTYGKVGNINSLPKITGAFLGLTQKCNLKCKYCFVNQNPKEMKLQTAIDAVEYLARNAKERNEVPSINFFGGEPLLKWTEIIVPLTKYVREKYGDKFDLSMTTNGILLDEEKLEYMKENRIGFMVSIDGNKKTQDLNRPLHNGQSSFNILAPKIPIFLKYNPNMTFRATVDHDNASEYFDNHKFAIENGYNNIFTIVNVFTEWTIEEKEELKKQIRKTADYYLELMLDNKDVSFSPFESMFSKINRIEIAKKNNQYRTAGEGLLAYGRCGLGASKFASIATDGTLYSCQEMNDNHELGKDFVIGSIYSGEDNEKRMAIISRFNPKKVHSTDGMKCEECPFDMICDGACTINNYFKNRDLNIMPSILCYYYQCLYEEALRIREVSHKYYKALKKFERKGILKDIKLNH